MVFTVRGRPLSELGLDNADVVDDAGNFIRKFEGFIALPGKTLQQSIQESLEPGEHLLIRPRLH
jgi:hypothetical protein